MEKSNKVALMTWFTYKNYGSALQASALFNTVRELGYEPEFINYTPKGNLEDTSNINLLKRLFKWLKSRKNQTYKSDKLEKIFENYYSEKFVVSEHYNSYAELYDLNEKYMAFICGSDQIWAPICYDSKYFLDFVKSNEKMIAYAPSIGCLKIDNQTVKTNMSRLISRFKHLSIREQQGADLIKDLTGQQATVVLDPTLLMDSKEWDEFINEENVQKIASEYIVCYFLGDYKKYDKYVESLSKKLKTPYFVIPVTESQKNSKRAVPFDVGPKEFVSLIRNAKHVCTDSFHGMAFSINYNVPFSVFKRFTDKDPKNQNSRIFNLLNLLGLQDRLVDYKEKIDVRKVEMCTFEQSNITLTTQRERSKAYLESALKQAREYVENVYDYTITNTCCGCGACASVCKHSAITVKKDENGFEKYSIDTNKCVKCGLCKTVCPMINIDAQKIEESKSLYSVKSVSEEVLKNSSSGGIAYELALKLMNSGYSICGCVYDTENNCARHIWLKPQEVEKLSLFQGSKYIQSITSDAFRELDNVTSESKIAFFGTPCQCSAVDKLLRKKKIREDSVVIDLICHGVPSEFLWKSYLAKIDKKYKVGKNPKVSFRCKDKSWRDILLKVEGKGRVYKKQELIDDFYAFFRRGLCYMESCYDCPYRERSSADIRVGDYWGRKFEKDKKGVSMVIANTQKGENLLIKLKDERKCSVEKQDLIEYWHVQYPYNHNKPLCWDNLIDDLKNEGKDLHSLRKKYCSYYDKNEKLSKLLLKVKRFIKRG